MMFRSRLFGGGPGGDEILDRPLSNFDIIGIPTGSWSSHILQCFSNIIPSCVLSFLCPCVLWSQIVVRSQIPLLIGLKNSLVFLRGQSGYGFFIDYFMVSMMVSIGLIIIMLVVTSLYYGLVIFFSLIVISLLGTLIFLLGNTRTAFREKYEIPGLLGEGAEAIDMGLDIMTMITCLPCALSQMARHVFQYDRMDTKLGLYFGDPSILPPLRPTESQSQHAGQPFERPRIADEAGLSWTDGRRTPGQDRNTGAAHRQEMLDQRQRDQILRETTATVTNPTAPNLPIAEATVSPNPNRSQGNVYNTNGTKTRF